MTMSLAERLAGAAMIEPLTVAMDRAIGQQVKNHGPFAALAALTAAVNLAVGPFGASEVARLLRQSADNLDGGQDRTH